MAAFPEAVPEADDGNPMREVEADDGNAEDDGNAAPAEDDAPAEHDGNAAPAEDDATSIEEVDAPI